MTDDQGGSTGTGHDQAESRLAWICVDRLAYAWRKAAIQAGAASWTESPCP